MPAPLIIAALMALAAAIVALARAPHTALARGAGAGWIALVASLGLILAQAVAGIAQDGVAAIAMVLTAFVGSIVLSFSRRYLRADRAARSYTVKVLLLLGSVIVFASATDVIMLATGWLVSGWLLASLIGHAGDWAEARASRRRAWITFAIGDAALLAGLALLASASGSLMLDRLGSAGSPRGTIGVALIVLAAAVRCALPPFQRWLSRSMTAPTPVSALMHAGFVNGGGLLLIRVAPALEAAPLARALTIAIGLVAALIGTAIMLVRPDIKRSLAGSTTAQMGFMLMTCGLGAYAAALWHLVAHGLFKAWLFLRSGSEIGIAPRVAPIALAPGVIAGLGVLAIAAVAVLGRIMPVPPAAVPVTLALVTALAMAARVIARPALIGPVVVIAIGYVAGLIGVDRALAYPAGPTIGGTMLPTLLVAIFMAAWLVQSLAITGRLRLPATAYARLLNA